MKVVFFGTPEFAVPSLEAVAGGHEVAAVVTRPDRPAGRGKQLVRPAVKEVALRLRLPVLQPARPGETDFVERVAALRPDVFVVVAYGRILPAPLLEVPRLGPWNIHASLLPRYRGAAPIQWAIIRGESKTGVCVMRMEVGLDTGPVAACRETPIGAEETAGALAGRLSQMGAELVAEALPKIAGGTLTAFAQNHAEATLAPLLKKEDGHFDFQAPASVVAALARGVDPWPGPTAFLGEEPVKLFGPRVVAASGEPGHVLGLGPDGLVVACGGAEAVAFRELQLPGRRRMAAAAVLAGRPIPVGTRLAGAPAGPPV